MKKVFILFILLNTIQVSAQKRNNANKAIYLENISWTQAKEVLTSDAVVVIPLGAGSKEHGPHLPLSSDFIQAEGAAKLLALERKVIITPVVNYGFYPAFLKYPGSVSLNFNTSTDMILAIVRSIAGYGPRRFYVINIGVSTTPTLAAASKVLADEGILLYYSQYDRSNFVKAEKGIKTKAFGGHVNEIETSSVLFLRPELVDMRKAVNDSSSQGVQRILSPVKMENTAYSPTGIVGYAALATKEKGKLYMQAYTKEVIREIDSITACALPQVKDRIEENKKYEGEYASSGGKTLIIKAEDNHLLFKQADTQFFAPFNLYCNGEDYFSAQTTTILFVKNEEGKVLKAWCQNRGENFWIIKTK